MRLEDWTAPWPHWANRWWGIAARILLAAAGTYFGISKIVGLLGETADAWDLGSAIELGVGVILITAAIAMAIYPSRMVLVALLLGLAAIQGLAV